MTEMKFNLSSSQESDDNSNLFYYYEHTHSVYVIYLEKFQPIKKNV